MGSGWFSPFFTHFSPFLRIFSSFSSLFSASPKGQGQTTAICCKNGEFHSDPVCTDPVQNFPSYAELATFTAMILELLLTNLLGFSWFHSGMRPWARELHTAWMKKNEQSSSSDIKSNSMTCYSSTLSLSTTSQPTTPRHMITTPNYHENNSLRVISYISEGIFWPTNPRERSFFFCSGNCAQNRNWRADFREGMRTATFQFQSPAVHWMDRTSSLNCLSCRNPYQAPHSLNASPLFTEKTIFISMKSASSHPLPKNRLL